MSWYYHLARLMHMVPLLKLPRCNPTENAIKPNELILEQTITLHMLASSDTKWIKDWGLSNIFIHPTNGKMSHRWKTDKYPRILKNILSVTRHVVDWFWWILTTKKLRNMFAILCVGIFIATMMKHFVLSYSINLDYALFIKRSVKWSLWFILMMLTKGMRCLLWLQMDHGPLFITFLIYWIAVD